MEKIILPHDHGNLPKELETWMPSGGIFETIADVLKIISDAKRVQIFWFLCHCEECVINISALVNLTSAAVSHHLKLLKTSGYIISRREGKEVYYTAAHTPRTQILHEMIEEIAEVSCPAEQKPVSPQDYNTNIQTVMRVHDFLLANIRSWYTAEELSKQFLINQTTLKTTFKTVYGQPIARYMKERRIASAKEMLAHSDMSIAGIASDVGYRNQSKFTQAFKDVTGMLPKEFRRLASKHS